MISRTSTLTEVAFAVCTAMDRTGFTVVLTGGSAATYHAPAAYQSADIDFVITLHGHDGEGALAALGYRRAADYYMHPQSAFPLEFPPGPLMIGDDRIAGWSTVRRRKQLLHVLTPTDSCRDRLASFLLWNDFSGLEQALAVCRACANDVDLDIVRDWCARERRPEKFDLFAARLRGVRVSAAQARGDTASGTPRRR